MTDPLARTRTLADGFSFQNLLAYGLPLLLLTLLFFPPQWEPKSTSFLVLGAWLLSLAAWRQPQTQPAAASVSVTASLAVWVAVFALAAAHSPYLAEGVNQTALLLAYLMLFLSAWTLGLHKPESLSRLTAALVAAAALLSVYGFYQHVYGLRELHQQLFGSRLPLGPEESELAGRLASGRAFAGFVYPNAFAGYLAMAAPLAAAGFAASAGRGRAWWGAGLGCCALGLYASGSMGGALAGFAGAAVTLAVMPAASREQRRWQLILAAAGIGLLALILGQRGGNAWFSAWPQRWSLWRDGLRLGVAHWLLGVGPGAFGMSVGEAGGHSIRLAHNFLVQAAAETGAAGLLAFLVFLIAAVRSVVKQWAAVPDRHRTLAAGLAGACAAGLLHAAVDIDLQVVKTATVFWVLAGALLGVASGREAQTEALPSDRKHPAWWLLAAWMALAVAVLWKGGKSAGAGLAIMLGSPALAWMVLARSSRESLQAAFQRVPFHWWLGALFVWGVASALFSGYPGAALSGLGLAAVGLLWYALAAMTPRAHRPLLQALSVAAALLAGGVLVLALQHPGERIAAGWPNPNLLAGGLALGLLVNVGLGLRPGLKLAQRLRYGLATLLLTLALFATGSMAGFAGALAGLALMLALRFRTAGWKWIVGGLLLVVLAAWLAPLALGHRLNSATAFRGLAYERAGMARAAIHMAGERPLSGWGPGNFVKGFERHKFPDIRGLARYGKYAEFSHNEFLQVLAVLGLPGMLLLLGLLVAVGRVFRSQAGTIATSGERLAAWGALAGAVVQSCLDFNWHLPGLWLWYMLLLAVAAAPAAAAEPGADPEPARPHALNRLLLAGLLLAAGVAGLRPMLAGHFVNLGDAQRYKQQPAAAVRHYETALALHPFSSEAYDRLGQVHADLYGALGADHEFGFAEWAFRRSRQLDRWNAYSHRHLAMLYAMKAARLDGEERARFFQAAAGEYQTACSKAPYNAILQFELGNVLRDSGRMDLAEKAWAQAASLEPKYAPAWSNLGVAQEMRDDFAAAEASFVRAKELQPLALTVQGKYEMELVALDYSVVHYNLAQLYERSNRPDLAGQEYRQALNRDPGNLRAKRRLQQLEKH